MKPFDIELAKAGHPVQTRDGRPVRILCYDIKSEFYPIVGLVESPDGTVENPANFTNDGRASIYTPTNLDLFMALNKKEGWINLYRSSIYVAGVSNVYETKEEALKASTEEGYILTKKIEWEE